MSDIGKAKSQTNADRIRNMSDEELGDLLPCPYMKEQYDECVHGCLLYTSDAADD